MHYHIVTGLNNDNLYPICIDVLRYVNKEKFKVGDNYVEDLQKIEKVNSRIFDKNGFDYRMQSGQKIIVEGQDARAIRKAIDQFKSSNCTLNSTLLWGSSYSMLLATYKEILPECSYIILFEPPRAGALKLLEKDVSNAMRAIISQSSKSIDPVFVKDRLIQASLSDIGFIESYYKVWHNYNSQLLSLSQNSTYKGIIKYINIHSGKENYSGVIQDILAVICNGIIRVGADENTSNKSQHGGYSISQNFKVSSEVASACNDLYTKLCRLS